MWTDAQSRILSFTDKHADTLLFFPLRPTWFVPGVTIKFGKFSAKENKQLEQNVHDFLALTGIESADKLLYTDRYPQEKSAITRLKRKYSFRMHIGESSSFWAQTDTFSPALAMPRPFWVPIWFMQLCSAHTHLLPCLVASSTPALLGTHWWI